jgi:hypothetical protein
VVRTIFEVRNFQLSAATEDKQRVLAHAPVHRQKPPFARLGKDSNRYGQTKRKNRTLSDAGRVTGDAPGMSFHTMVGVNEVVV